MFHPEIKSAPSPLCFVVLLFRGLSVTVFERNGSLAAASSGVGVVPSGESEFGSSAEGDVVRPLSAILARGACVHTNMQ